MKRGRFALLFGGAAVVAAKRFAGDPRPLAGRFETVGVDIAEAREAGERARRRAEHAFDRDLAKAERAVGHR